MKKSLLYCVFIFGLVGCHFPHLMNTVDEAPVQPKAQPKVETRIRTITRPHQFQQLINYGAEFAAEFERKPRRTCAKYNQRYKKSDWRAGWVMSMAVAKASSKHCFSFKDTVWFLKHLESKKVVDPKILWLNQYYSLLVQKLQKATDQATQSDIDTDKNQQLIDELIKENQELTEKLNALKDIETNFNHTSTNR